MKNRYNFFKWGVFLLFIIFLTLYFSQLTGYYEYQNYQKMIMTEEKIKQFEQDIKDGKEVNITDYTEYNIRNYDNSLSNIGLNLSKLISDIVEDSIIKLFGSIASIVNE